MEDLLTYPLMVWLFYTGAASTGSFDAVPFNAGTGDIISTSNWVPGSWPGEISWEILDGGML